MGLFNARIEQNVCHRTILLEKEHYFVMQWSWRIIVILCFIVPLSLPLCGSYLCYVDQSCVGGLNAMFYTLLSQ